MKKIILIILVLLCIGCSNNKPSYQKINNDKLYQVIEEIDNYVILDVRTFPEYNNGHIENAINIPVDGINEDTVRNLDTDDYIIVYCQSGNRSRQAALKLLDLGYINVFDYGSIDNYDGEIINKETNE